MAAASAATPAPTSSASAPSSYHTGSAFASSDFRLVVQPRMSQFMFIVSVATQNDLAPNQLLDENREAAAVAACDYANLNIGLHLAAATGESEACQKLLSENQLDVNGVIAGATPLMFAIMGANSADTVKLLLSHGADPNKKCTGSSITAIMLASMRGSNQTIKILLEAGADANICDVDGRFPIEAAAYNGFIDCVNTLFAYTDPLPRYENWNTAELMRLFPQDEDFFDASDELEPAVEEERQMHNMNSVPEIAMYRVPQPRHNESNNAPGPSQTQDNSNDAIKEKKSKANLNFFYAHMDKVPTLLLAVSLMGITAVAHGDLLKMHNGLFQMLCAGTAVSVTSSVSLFAHAAYFKETEAVSEIGYKICSWIILAALLYLLLICVIVIGFEKANPSITIPSGIVTATLIILTWRIPNEDSLTIGAWLWNRVNHLRHVWRDNRLPRFQS